MAVFFGTDGLRGIVSEDLTYDMAFKCGNSLSQMLLGKGRVIIARDTRVSGSFIESALAAGLMAGGVDVYLAKVLPTAGLAYLTKTFKFDYGIVITASHNPAEYNGIKILSSNGEKLQDKEEEKVERGFIKTRFNQSLDVGKSFDASNLRENYIDFLLGTADTSLEGLKIVLDCSNGASYKIAPRVFRQLGAKVYTTGCKGDGERINHGCGSLHPERLASRVVKLGADLGFAFDGDADRLLAVDSKGQIIDGDRIILALAKSYKKEGELYGNSVVGTSLTNMGIEKELEDNGIKLFRADVGDKYVASLMSKQGSFLGGEQSGHIIIKKFLNTGDGILSAVQLACKLKKSGLKLCDFCAAKLYPQVIKNVVVSDKLRTLGSETLSLAISNAQQELAGLGRVLVRASGTEPKIRIMVESEKLWVSQNLANYLCEVITSIEQSEAD